jgi:hypothetical protein
MNQFKFKLKGKIMDRIVKFKGYSEIYGRWLKGFYVKHPDGTCYISETYKGGQWVEVVAESVGQYVGKDDLNKVEVYEGDIVKYASFVNWKNHCGFEDARNLGVIIFDDKGYNYKNGFCIEMLEEVYNSGYNSVSKVESMNVTNATWGLEVVGNIYSDKLTKKG